MLKKHVTLIITGSIAAPKAVVLLKKLELDFLVTVICTKSATYFLNDKNFQFQSEMFEKFFYDKKDNINHTSIALQTDLIVVYPATMNFVSKVATAIADSLALLTFLASPMPKMIFLAMNHYMYHNAIFQEHLKLLAKQAEIAVYKPNRGMLACKIIGDGRAQEPDDVYAIIKAHFNKIALLKNKTVLINYGRVRTYVDAIRYITNLSSGKMGQALVNAFLQNGANVISVLGDVDFDVLNQPNLTIIKADTNQKMLKVMQANFEKADIVLSVAALNDYEVATTFQSKVSKTSNPNLTLKLTPAVDVLQSLGKMKTKQLLIGFAAQNESDINLGKIKMVKKNCDGICINNIKVMGRDYSQIEFYLKDKVYELKGKKTEIAKQIVSIIGLYFKNK